MDSIDQQTLACPQAAAARSQTPVPARMAHLPIDERGYVVPWFVAWVDGKPEFRAMDPEKFSAAIRKKLCWVCGGKMGVNLCFVAGPCVASTGLPASRLRIWSARDGAPRTARS